MILWPTSTRDMEGTLFLVDRKEDKIILIINHLFDEWGIIYKPDSITQEMENIGASLKDVLESETECLDFDRQIFRVFWEA